MSGNVPVSSTLDAMFTELYGAAGGNFTGVNNINVGSGAGIRSFSANGGTGAAEGAAFIGRRAGANSFILGDAGSILGSGGADTVLYTYGANNQRFYTNGAERIRIDSAGYTDFIGAARFRGWASLATTFPYVQIGVPGGAYPNISLFSPTPVADNRLWDFTTDANSFSARVISDNIATVATWLSVVRAAAVVSSIGFGGSIRPLVDNAYSCGVGAQRWSVVYAATGAINTSDAREKTKVAALTESELACASALAKEIGVFQFLASRDEKGADGARLHIGSTVQRVMEVMTEHGLEPTRYAFICYDEWDEETTPAELDADGNETKPASVRPAGNRYGFRTDQLALFIARGQEERLRRIEERLNAKP